MRPLILNMFLAITWVELTAERSTENLIVGALFGYILIWAFRDTLFPNASYTKKPHQVVYFIGFFLWELLIANIRVAKEVLSPTLTANPAIVAVPLDLESDIEITTLANLITLTPGTLSLDVSEDRKTLYVHTMYLDNNDVEAFRTDIKNGFEQRVREFFE